MSRPKAYDPQEGYKYQILTRANGEREWEHCDYAETRLERNHLIAEYDMAYAGGFQFKTILLPAKYWPPLKGAPNER